MNFAERRKLAEDAGMLSSGERLKLKEGPNRVRLVSECLPHKDDYQGKPTFKWLCYVLDRVDGKAKLFFMPHTIYKLIEALQVDPDYGFEDVPMPYDITITAKGAGNKDVEYSLIPAKKETPITALEYQELAGLKPLQDVQKALLAKTEKATPAGHSDDPGPSDGDFI